MEKELCLGGQFVITFTIQLATLGCLSQTIPMELPVIRREYQNGMYTTVPYFLSKIIAELPYLITLPTLQLAICYFMIGMLFLSVIWATKNLGSPQFFCTQIISNNNFPSKKNFSAYIFA